MLKCLRAVHTGSASKFELYQKLNIDRRIDKLERYVLHQIAKMLIIEISSQYLGDSCIIISTALYVWKFV